MSDSLTKFETGSGNSCLYLKSTLNCDPILTELSTTGLFKYYSLPCVRGANNNDVGALLTLYNEIEMQLLISANYR